MRGYLQQIRRQLVNHPDTSIGWILFAVATAIYLLTLAPSTSFWDCGEFIAVSYRLQVGHPPGAPLYQLLCLIFSLLSFGQDMNVAWWCNCLSALSAGATVMFLYWSIMLLIPSRLPYRRLGAIVGSLCYLFCDTAWFSAVESEVYSLAMLLASVIVWAMLSWYHCEDRKQASRWLLIIALLMGLGFCTHQLVLLTAPTVLILFIIKIVRQRKSGAELPIREFLTHVLPLGILFFIIGLTPYLIIPIRAAAGTPINEGNPSNTARFRSYLARDQYEKAPLYPRMWRHRGNDDLYAQAWNGGDTGVVGNMTYYFSYQLTYMYFRYLMWNFSGRYNDRQGYGSPQNGQFITGIPIFDRMLVGTSARPPDSLHTRGHNVYYLLPLLLGIFGAFTSHRLRRQFWTVMSLFLMGGVILNIYLNHPCYEPRERDYAYILSFYAFCMFIAFGVSWSASHIKLLALKVSIPPKAASGIAGILLFVPLLMACQNWDDHNRSHRYLAHDAAYNMLNSCDEDELGTVLFTHGDNDTFPLWYLQTVEEERTDIHVANIGLMGWNNFTNLLRESEQMERPIYFTHYAYDKFSMLYPGRFQLEGTTYRLMPHSCDSVNTEACLRHFGQMQWHSLEGVHIDETGCRFLESHWRDMLLIADNLFSQDRSAALEVLRQTLAQIPLNQLQDVKLRYDIIQAFNRTPDDLSQELTQELKQDLIEQLAYYRTMPPRRQRSMPFTIGPKEEIYNLLTLQATPPID